MVEIVLGIAAAIILTMSSRMLLPMIAVRLRLGTLLAADATTLAPATDANLLQLIIAPFTLNENLVASGLTFGTTLGLAPIACATGAQGVAIDPVSQSQIITLIPGTGTFRWVTSGSWTAGITVYGIALTDSTGANLLAAEQFQTPIALSAPGYQIDVDPAQMTFVLAPIS
jgi:hypothetical protein